ncbi:MAG: agmatinase [Hyphomicrobiaceae bacterium]|nr:agmatinase [Hyphomicrobiaceae bacterium]
MAANNKTTLDYLPGDESFLDPLRLDANAPEKARVVVIPFGYEATVSYGGGTNQGPKAIMQASHQLELWDEELWREPYIDYGIAAVREPKIAKSAEAALKQVEQLVEATLAAGKVPFVLGGEHSITAGAIRPVVRRYPKDLVVLQLDAHWDLRDGYLGENYSHAAAMRRVLDQPGHENITLVSAGIRAFSKPEAEYYEANKKRIHVAFAKDQTDWDIKALLKPLKGRPVYITFDIDGLDSNIMPATGTPVPGGMTYMTALAILRRACETAGEIVGMDLVEFAPIKGFHAYDFLAAQLAAKMLNYAFSGTEPQKPNKRK